MVCNRRTPLLTVVETRTPEEYNFILKRFSLGIICPLVPQFFEEVAEESRDDDRHCTIFMFFAEFYCNLSLNW